MFVTSLLPETREGVNMAAKINERTKRRLELFKLFQPLDQNSKRRWARIFNSSFYEITEALQHLALEKGYKQEILKNKLIFWEEKNTHDPECMFYFIDDSTDFACVSGLFKYIAKHKPFLTYVILRQLNEEENVFDIFISSKHSYLEHCNRVKYWQHKIINATAIDHSLLSP